MQKRFVEITKVPMSKQQEALIRRMMAIDAIELSFGQEQAEEIKEQLYNLFFKWQFSKQDLEQHAQNDSEEERDKVRKEEEAKDERKKKAQLKHEQDLLDFEARGGFVRVLKDIFNPVDKDAMQLDPVF
jgi:hypothetical protein